MTRITIVTITYQAAKVLQPTLDSVACQHHEWVEHIIVDGASTDGTVKMAEAYKQQSDAMDNGHEVRVLSEPDNGLYDAMNKGLQMATGDYVCFLNAGDRLADEETLARVAEVAEAYSDGVSPAVVYGDTDIIDAEGRFVRHRRLSPPETLSWRSFKHGMLVCHQAFYARTQLARQVPYDTRYRFSADVDWCIRVMKKAEEERDPLCHAGKVLALYLEEGQTTLHHKESLRERFDVMRRHYGLFITVAMHAWFVIRATWRKLKFF
ncbi:MAG: glycosyltransferase [Prevotella sp.]|nr:glycosyltransferase [Prevotella sp.]